MSTKIIVRALEAELEKKASHCASALFEVGETYRERAPSPRVRVDQARQILDKAAAEYDAVAAELQAARVAFNLASPAAASSLSSGERTHE
jgi:hypothetical protein